MILRMYQTIISYAPSHLAKVGTSAGRVMQSSGRALHMSYDVLSGYHSVLTLHGIVVWYRCSLILAYLQGYQ